MREILFRGKCTDTGRWYEGQYIHLHNTTYCFKEDCDRDPDNDIHQIVFEKMTDWGLPNRHLRADVLPETVGQYTGLKDKNGKKIFEGDIVTISSAAVCMTGIVEFHDCGFEVREGDTYECLWYAPEELEIIGNIHDNPDLLRGAEDGNWKAAD